MRALEPARCGFLGCPALARRVPTLARLDFSAQVPEIPQVFEKCPAWPA
jgi:hypothetical protein